MDIGRDRMGEAAAEGVARLGERIGSGSEQQIFQCVISLQRHAFFRQVRGIGDALVAFGDHPLDLTQCDAAAVRPEQEPVKPVFLRQRAGAQELYPRQRQRAVLERIARGLQRSIARLFAERGNRDLGQFSLFGEALETGPDERRDERAYRLHRLLVPNRQFDGAGGGKCQDKKKKSGDNAHQSDSRK